MAARRRRRFTRTRTVYRRAKRGYIRRKGLISGNLSKAAWGGGAAFARQFIPDNLPIVGKFGKASAFAAAGYFLKKPDLFTIAGYEAGLAIFTNGGLGTAGSSFWE